jgi:hypothetical protein
MEQQEFLEKNIFIDLKNLNEGLDNETNPYFSETDFEIVLERLEYFGIGVYKLDSWLNGESFSAATHEDFNKKATDPQWYTKAFKTFKTRQSGLIYSASYKVSNKLLARFDTVDNAEEEE